MVLWAEWSMYINVACLKNRAESAPTSSLFDQRNTISWLKKKKNYKRSLPCHPWQLHKYWELILAVPMRSLKSHAYASK